MYRSSTPSLRLRVQDREPERAGFPSLTAVHFRLFKSGLQAEDKLREVELLQEKAALELKQLETAKKTAQLLTKTQLEGITLELKQLEKERDEAIGT